jgi:hypothetical protein
MEEIDFKKLNKASFMTKRMYILDSICRSTGIDIYYLFGLFGLYNKKNSGVWFWQKARLTGELRENYNRFNTAVDNIVKDLKKADGEMTKQQIDSALDIFKRLLGGMEANCDVERNSSFIYVKSFLDKNLKILIDDSLKRIK